MAMLPPAELTGIRQQSGGGDSKCNSRDERLRYIVNSSVDLWKRSWRNYVQTQSIKADMAKGTI